MNTRTDGCTVRWLFTFLLVAITLLAPLSSSAIAAPPPPVPDEYEEAQAVEVLLPDRETLNYLVSNGWDLDHDVSETEDGITVTVIATPSEFDYLESLGILPLGKMVSQEAQEKFQEQRQQALTEQAEALEATDTVTILRADYWQSDFGEYISVEAKSSAGSVADLTASWEGGSMSLFDFVDAGVYLYHRRSTSVGSRPVSLTVTSDQGGSATAPFTEWLPDEELKWDYQSGFVDGYMDPTELYARIESLAAEFPDLAEIVELPHLTNGYRRQAMGLINGPSSSTRIVITSHAWGHESGNGLIVETLDPGAADQPLAVSVSGNTISVSLATAADGSLTSTAAEVIAAINADPQASALVRADAYRESSAGGLVSPQSIELTDYLDAPPEISREPWRVRAIRVGRYRDGSRLGVLAYAQEHAREWVPPLVAVETAERLLRNYAHGGHTKYLLDNLDIFIIPSVNPDGAHYSFYDFAFQRKNLTNYCLGGPRNDPNSRNTWGVDVNRNYDVGSIFDGYDGASSSCSSAVYSGPAELSEPESSNVVWIADTFDNIRFSMNIHSTGNYFMWSPGAYIMPARESLPRPTLGEETYFWYASERILQAIKAHRGLVVTPGRTGPIVDVLYSAAGNSGDRLWYENGFYAWNFEVGSSGFQPDWEEAFQETMEFSNGLIELFEVSLDFAKDNQVPQSWLVDSEGKRIENKKFEGEAILRFENSEAASIYFTLDGSRPTFSSPVYSSDGIREPGATMTFMQDTTVNWFAIDSAGNISNHYKPDEATSVQYYSSEIRFE